MFQSVAVVYLRFLLILYYICELAYKYDMFFLPIFLLMLSTKIDMCLEVLCTVCVHDRFATFKLLDLSNLFVLQ